MATLDDQERRGPPDWSWLIGVLMFALGAGTVLIWWLAEKIPGLIPILPQILP